jgi:hypothetical protein
VPFTVSNFHAIFEVVTYDIDSANFAPAIARFDRAVHRLHRPDISYAPISHGWSANSLHDLTLFSSALRKPRSK